MPSLAHSTPVEAVITSLAHDGRGVTHLAGKAVFVSGALSGERVLLRYRRRTRHHDEAEVVTVLEPAAERVPPRCPHFAVCGGCSWQHVAPAAQIGLKQQIVAEILQRIGKVTPAQWLPPLTALHWGYRRKARLGMRYVNKKGRLVLGFRERYSSFIADLEQCPILHPAVGEQLLTLRNLLEQLTCREHIAQLEMAQGDDVVILVLRVLQPPSAADVARLIEFSAASGIVFYLQPGGLDSIQPLPGQSPVPLAYTLPAVDVTIGFEPTDFTQVNLELNRLLIQRTLELLDPQPTDRVVDLFCGVGNFTLPLARFANQVVGVEGDASLITRAQANAQRNQLPAVQFQLTDLYRADGAQTWNWCQQSFNKAVLDPPRSGALSVLNSLAATGVERIVYVSCYPATLARDAAHLVQQLGYRFIAAAALDMFPHTAHVETLALFER